MISIFTYKIGVKVLTPVCQETVGEPGFRPQPRPRSGLEVVVPNRPVDWSGVGPTGSVPHDAPYLMHI